MRRIAAFTAENFLFKSVYDIDIDRSATLLVSRSSDSIYVIKVNRNTFFTVKKKTLHIQAHGKDLHYVMITCLINTAADQSTNLPQMPFL